MGRNFDPIDIIFIVLIGIYLVTLFAIILVLVYGKKEDKPIRYKVIEVISPKKKKRKNKIKATTEDTKSPKKTTKKKTTTQNNDRYKGKAPTKKKTAPRKKKPKTNGVNKKRKK